MSTKTPPGFIPSRADVFSNLNLHTAGKSKGHRSLSSMLGKEKYKGDALLQKYYTPDFLTKKQIHNNGEVPQYYAEGNSHECLT